MTDIIPLLRDDIKQNVVDPESALLLIYYKSVAQQYRYDREWQKSYDKCMEVIKLLPNHKHLYCIYEELSIVCFYLGKKSEGYDAAERVTLGPYTPYRIRNYTLSNQQYYMDKLAVDKVIDTDFKTDCSTFVPSSSSILNMGNDNYRVNVRSVNYRIINGTYPPQGNSQIITRNHIVDLDGQFKATDCKELIDKSGYPMTYNTSYSKGLEDLRLIDDGRFLCTTPNSNKRDIPQLTYGEYNVDDGAIIKIVPLQLGNELKCEKNWMPFILDGHIHAIYSMNPLTIVKITPDLDTPIEERVQVVQTNDSIRLHSFRGSGGLIEYKGGYLCSIHQVHYNQNRLYFHRMVWFTKDFSSCKYSKAFYFESPNIEYTLSMCHSDHGLIIPYSVRDSCSKLAILSYSKLDEMLSL